MVLSYDDIKEKNLQRYHDNKTKYNERQKTYFRNTYYVNNREKMLEYQQNYRNGNTKNNTKQPKRTYSKVTKQSAVIIEKNIKVTFD